MLSVVANAVGQLQNVAHRGDDVVAVQPAGNEVVHVLLHHAEQLGFLRTGVFVEQSAPAWG